MASDHVSPTPLLIPIADKVFLKLPWLVFPHIPLIDSYTCPGIPIAAQVFLVHRVVFSRPLVCLQSYPGIEASFSGFSRGLASTPA